MKYSDLSLTFSTETSTTGWASTVQLTILLVPLGPVRVALLVKLPTALTITLTVITAGVPGVILVKTQVRPSLSNLTTSAPVTPTTSTNSKPTGKLSTTVNSLV